jgi:hypothetical protein
MSVASLRIENSTLLGENGGLRRLPGARGGGVTWARSDNPRGNHDRCDFEVMTADSIREAPTLDRHFSEAGFEVLPA